MLKQRLSDTDYKTHKWVEGELSDEEYRIHCHERRIIRGKINALESEIEELDKEGGEHGTE